MKKQRKQLLGALGLAFVIGMTAVALFMPSPDAEAVVGQKEGDVTIKVTVQKPTSGGGSSGGGTSTELLPTVNLTEPLDSSVWLWGRGGVPVVTSYENSNQLVYLLSCEHEGATLFEDEELLTVDVSDTRTGTYKFQLTDEMVLKAVELAKEKDKVSATGFRLATVTTTVEELAYDFKLSVKSIGDGGRESLTDVTRFMYREVFVTAGDGGNGNFDFSMSNNVYRGVVQVYDPQTGKPVFVNANGDEEPVIITREQILSGNFKVQSLLPMAKYGAKKGTYDMVIVAYDEDGKVLSMNTVSFEYNPDLDVPNTGSIFGNLNISRADYVITGVVAFGAVAVFMIYLIVRKNKR